MKLRNIISSVVLALLACFAPAIAQQPLVGNEFDASRYNYGGYQGPNQLVVDSTNSGSGLQSYTLQYGYIILNGGVGGGRQVMPLNINAPILIDGELLTPSAVSCGTPQIIDTCIITITSSSVHGKGSRISSGTAGLQEALNDAFLSGGGFVMLDGSWNTAAGGTAAANALVVAAIPYGNVSIADGRSGAVNFYNLQMTAATFLAAPTTLTAVTALPSATPVGAYGTGTYHMCVAYVDVAGQEGPCSADFSEAGLATGSFIFTAPAASTGAVGYTIYISLTSGTYSLAYQVPLTSSICTLTKVETVTPACAVTNTVYSQTGSTATVTAITVSTSLVDPQLAGVSGTLLTPAANGRTTYAYVGSGHVANGGLPTVMLAYTIGGIGSATPISIGSVNVPVGFMNQVGKTIEICGRFINTDASSSVQSINIYWDAAGSNVAGSPVLIGALASTQTGTAALYNGSFCEDFTTTVSAATATGGSIRPGMNWLTYLLTSANTTFGIGGDTNTAAVASLDLAGVPVGNGSRINIVHTNTSGNATPQLVALTIRVL